jgi:UTP--glucose-1-phosphate uridylyltransferase
VYAENNNLRINPARDKKRKSDVAVVKLDPKFYKKIDSLEARFADGIPSLIDCDSLTIEGDVKFEKNVTVKGSVVIRNTQQSQSVVKEGSVIDSDLVF